MLASSYSLREASFPARLRARGVESSRAAAWSQVTILNARGEMNKYPRSSVNRTPGGERLRGQARARPAAPTHPAHRSPCRVRSINAGTGSAKATATPSAKLPATV